LRTLVDLSRPGALLVIGTPDAAVIDLSTPQPFVHMLHQPYHRHIFSRSALTSIGDKLSWELEHYYPTQYSNTYLPFINSRFVMHYFRACDDTLDLAVEPIRATNLRLYAPDTLFWALFGGFFAPESDVMVVYRKAG